LLTMKAAASVDQLSNGRLLLGIASGDRPVEYPLFGRDFAGRGQAFREQVGLIRNWAADYLPPGIQVLPRPQQPLPLLVAGLAQQTPAWLGQQMNGCLAYPGTPEDHAHRAAAWRAVAGNDKPYISFIHLDLADDPDAPMRRHRFGGRVGRKGLVAELAAMQEAGVSHIGLHFRQNRRPLAETMAEIAEFVLPEFHLAGSFADVAEAATV
ncbi:MAG: Luciferase-type oxidoreductase, family protein, partial [Collimonas fungivorans]|uniref:LLM class flavin-dependent oxidoreductase n=1 Tax=Collimonas fungivorans TaxID=158899 RepID=UPI0026EF2DDA